MKSLPLSLILLLYFTKQAQFSPTDHDNDKKLSWIEAVEFCKNKSLSLESNKTKIEMWLKENGTNTEAWFGMYKELTDWAHIQGCYNTNEIQKDYDENDRLVCQKLCKKSTGNFFAVKNGCMCIPTVQSLHSCRCNDPHCTTVWKHILDDYDEQNYRNATLQCIAVSTTGPSGGIIINRKYDLCNRNHRVVCENGVDFMYEKDTYPEKASLCRNNGSFIKWFTDESDFPNTIGNGIPLWTSGIRSLSTFFISKIDVINKNMLFGCSSITVSSVINNDRLACNKSLPFLCEKVSPRPAITNKIAQEQSVSVGAIVGSVLAVLFVVAVSVIVILIIIKQRTKKKDNAQVKSTNTKSVSNLGYNFQVTESSDIKTHKTDYGYPRVTGINNDKNVTINYNLAKPIKDEKGGDYIFAQPIDSDSDYAYNSDYDHFNNPVKTTNNSDHYTSAGQAKKIYDDKNGTYDHLSSFERKTNDEESCLNSNYDHLPNITGSDPTYDVSGDVIHDDSDKYDHLPPNFNADTSFDYQSTRVFPGSVKDDAYDHFEIKE